MASLKGEKPSNFLSTESVVSIEDAANYAKDIAHTVANPLKDEISLLKQKLATANAGTTNARRLSSASNLSGNNMNMNINNTELNSAMNDVAQETVSSAKLMGGKALLKVITQVAEKLVFSKMGWTARAFTSEDQKKFYVNVATYLLVHAIKTGGFGLTKYRISHPALNYVTLAANQLILEYAAESVFGGNFELVNELFSAPTVATAAADAE